MSGCGVLSQSGVGGVSMSKMSSSHASETGVSVAGGRFGQSPGRSQSHDINSSSNTDQWLCSWLRGCCVSRSWGGSSLTFFPIYLQGLRRGKEKKMLGKEVQIYMYTTAVCVLSTMLHKIRWEMNRKECTDRGRKGCARRRKSTCLLLSPPPVSSFFCEIRLLYS